MEVLKCLEYYFEEGTSTEEIIQYVQKNIDELKKTSKIKEAKTDIKTNEYGAKIARLTLTIEEKSKKSKKMQETKGPLYNNLSADFKEIKFSKMLKDRFQEKQKGRQEKKQQKEQEKLEIQQIQQKRREEKKIETKEITNPIVKIEMEVPVRKYGAYKEGGKFTPYQPKKKKRFIDIIKKRKEND